MAKTPTKSAPKPSVKTLTKTLEDTVKKAKGLGKTSPGLESEIARSESVIAQTKKQGSKAYAGSSFENEYLKSDAYKKGLVSAGTPAITSKMGKTIVEKADKTMNNLSAQPPEVTTPMQTTPTTPTTPATGTQKATDPSQTQTGTQTPAQTDFMTFVNETTGQEQTLRGTANTPEARANLEKQGYKVATADTSTTPKNPEMAQLEADITSADKELSSFMTKLEGMIVTDKELRGEISGIKSGYNARIQEMQNVNERRRTAMETLGIRYGSRYTGGSGGIMGSILSEEERQGLMRINEIENDKQKAVLDAKKAARDQNFSLYAKLADKAEAKQDAKRKELATLKEAQQKQDQKLEEERKKLNSDIEVANIMKEGITDPLDIYARLVASGNVGDYTLGDIISTSAKLKDFNKPEKGTSSSGSIVDGIDIENAKMSQVRSLARKLLPADIASQAIAKLTDEELRDFLLKWNEYNDQNPSELTYTPAPSLLSQYAVNDLSKPIQKSGTFNNETNDPGTFLKEYLSLTDTSKSSSFEDKLAKFSEQYSQ